MHRKMVEGLHRIGFRVVLDVVYNHTFHSLQDGGSLKATHLWLESSAICLWFRNNYRKARAVSQNM